MNEYVMTLKDKEEPDKFLEKNGMHALVSLRVNAKFKLYDTEVSCQCAIKAEPLKRWLRYTDAVKRNIIHETIAKWLLSQLDDTSAEVFIKSTPYMKIVVDQVKKEQSNEEV